MLNIHTYCIVLCRFVDFGQHENAYICIDLHLHRSAWVRHVLIHQSVQKWSATTETLIELEYKIGFRHVGELRMNSVLVLGGMWREKKRAQMNFKF